MDKQEFFLIIPGVIYGVAIVDLLKVVAHKNNYFEVVGWGTVYLLGIVNLWVDLYKKLDAITQSNLSFLLIIIQAVIYSRGAHIITPEEKDVNTKEYFLETKKEFFTILILAVSCNILIQEVVKADNTPLWSRLLGLVVFSSLIFIDKVWYRTIFMLVIGTLLLVDLLTPGGVYQQW